MISKTMALSVYGLKDLIAGKLPVFTGWTVDPTDAGDITDNDPTTVCTTGSANIGAYVQRQITYDLGSLKNVMLEVSGKCVTTAGTPRLYVYAYNGSAWVQMSDIAGSTSELVITGGGMFSKVRLAFTATSAGTISPYVRRFGVWRLQ